VQYGVYTEVKEIGLTGKEEVLVVRMAAEDKKQIADAARKRGESITNFITSTALKEAKKVLARQEANMEKTITRPTHGGIPTFFKALCMTASEGGAHSYKYVGNSFGAATAGEIPWDANDDEWENMLEEVRRYIENEDRESIWQWYKEVYPSAMKLISARRRDSFVDGILEAYTNGKLWFL